MIWKRSYNSMSGGPIAIENFRFDGGVNYIGLCYSKLNNAVYLIEMLDVFRPTLVACARKYGMHNICLGNFQL